MKTVAGDWGRNRNAEIRRKPFVGMTGLAISAGLLSTEELPAEVIVRVSKHDTDNPKGDKRRVVVDFNDGRSALLECTRKEMDELVAVAFKRERTAAPAAVQPSTGARPAMVVSGASAQPTVKRKSKTSLFAIAVIVFVGAAAVAGGAAGSRNRAAPAPAAVAAPKPAPSPVAEAAAYTEELKTSLIALKAFGAEGCSGSKDAITVCVVAIAAYSDIYEQGAKLELTEDQQAVRADFKAKVSAHQKKVLPILRDRIGPLLAEIAWEDDIKVQTRGAGFSTIRFTGGLFAANRNIKQMQEAMLTTFSLLRFKRSEYLWYKDASEYDYYEMGTLDDGQLAKVVGGVLVAVGD